MYQCLPVRTIATATDLPLLLIHSAAAAAAAVATTKYRQYEKLSFEKRENVVPGKKCFRKHTLTGKRAAATTRSASCLVLVATLRVALAARHGVHTVHGRGWRFPSRKLSSHPESTTAPRWHGCTVCCKDAISNGGSLT